MAARLSDGSPKPSRRPSTHFTIYEEVDQAVNSGNLTRQSSWALKQNVSKQSSTSSEGIIPLSTSRLANIQPQQTSTALASMAKSDQSTSLPYSEVQQDTMDTLMAKLSEQQAAIAKQKSALNHSPMLEKPLNSGSSADSALLTPASDSFNHASEGSDGVQANPTVVARLQKELDDAKEQLARQKQELEQSRVIKQTFDQAVESSSEAGHSPQTSVKRSPEALPSFQRSFNTTHGMWSIEDTRNEGSDVVFPMNNGWANSSRSGPSSGPQTNPFWLQTGPRIWGQRSMDNGLSPLMMSQQQPSQQRNYSVPISPGRRGFDIDNLTQSRDFGRNGKNSSVFQSGIGWNSFSGSGAIDGSNLNGINTGSAFPSLGVFSTGYQPQPIGTPLSPTANEFRAGQGGNNPWNNARASSPGVYVSPMEPLNYRRLLDRNVSCDWKYIVDKIICNNDQQASIFLQQKLKVGTAAQKYEIVESIVAQAYPLMVNRFGNFLVQRCFEHGTPEQVVAIANAIRGNTLSLSMDAFGCHVVQKAFDSVPEEYKAIMVHELLRRIPETVIHRYACHVWQKLFELRWSDSPPQIMKYVNEALCGMWHEVALGETGSLVVQNIFENCLEEDKRPCINEVLNSIDIVAHGQFGNWCIQHICEHGAPADRSRAVDHVLRYATEYSMDQYASKVIEKCLKIGGSDFLEHYLERVCEGRADRPRIPLIDIASDQYGNYLIQYILTHASSNHRELVASHIRKHMVSLRGSKFGSRVGMLCCNPAYATHPGPAVGLPPARSFSAQATSITRPGGTFR